MKKVIGYILFYVRLTQKGDKLVWSNEQSLVCQGTLGAGRVWSAPKPGSPPVLYFNPSDKPYADTDMDSIVEGGYATIYVKEDFLSYLTPTQMNALLTPQPVVAPTVTPTVEQPVVTAQ